ncbi:hypothetical protein ACLKA6_008523 [Drosophila palustris]
MSSSSNSPSAIIKPTPKSRLLDDANVHRIALLKQACEYSANTKEDDCNGRDIAQFKRNRNSLRCCRFRGKLNRFFPPPSFTLHDEFDLWGKSVAATLRNFPDAAAVRLAKSKMNIIMASLEAGELTSSIIAP